MAKSDYFGLGYIVSVILAIIPPTSCICGAITRISEGKIVAGILRILLGWNVILGLRPGAYDCQQAHSAPA